MMRDFELWLNTRFLFGRGVHKKAGNVLKQMGVSRVLIHHDGGAYLYDTGLLESVRDDLESNGMTVWELPGVKPNPRLDLVYEGIRCVKENQIDFILAIGGGSVIDSSKAIAAGALYDGDVWDFFTKGIRVSRSVPVGVILTCPATGSESGDVSVINNTRTGQKLLTSSQALRPVLAFMNPELTVSLPAFVTACSVADMFSHVCERYFTPDDEIGVIDRMAEGLMVAIKEATVKAVRCPHDYEARATLMWGGSLSHNGLTGTGRTADFASHKIEHEMGGMFDVTHGAGLCAIWGSWARYVYKTDVARFAQFASRIFSVPLNYHDLEETALKGIEAWEDWCHKIGMPTSMKELGISPTEEQINEMADKCVATGGGHVGFFQTLYKDDVMNIYRMSR